MRGVQMKKSMILLAVLGLSGCSSLVFDNLEFDRFITVSERADNMIRSCSNSSIIKIESGILLDQVTHMDNYAKHRGSAQEIGKSIAIVRSMVAELNTRYEDPRKNPSVIYCREKLKNISLASSAISDTLGRLQ